MISEGQWHLRGPQLTAFMFGGPESTCWPHYNHCFPPWLCSISLQGCQLCPLQKPTLAFFVLSSHVPVHVLHKVIQTNFKSFLKRSFQGPACFLFCFMFIYFLLVLLPCLEKLLQFSRHDITHLLMSCLVDYSVCPPAQSSPISTLFYALRGGTVGTIRGSGASLASGRFGSKEAGGEWGGFLLSWLPPCSHWGWLRLCQWPPYVEQPAQPASLGSGNCFFLSPFRPRGSNNSCYC